MSTTLGLDIGTNSIGWCLMEDGKEIKDIGVRIFPVGVMEDDYAKSGTEISRNAARRVARGARRLNDRYKLRRKQLKKLLLELGMMPTEEMIIKIKPNELYYLRKKGLDEQLTLKELGRVLLHLNQRRGFKSSKKDAKTEEQKKEKSEYLQKMDQMQHKVTASGSRTVGEYFYSLFQNNKNIPNWHNELEPAERIRNNFIYRALYIDEFDKIWEKQKTYYPQVLNDEIKKKIKDNCIYYQRPLKSQKHLVAKCRFEPKKKVAPRSSFDFQEFRIWQTLNNFRITYEKRYNEPLTIEEKTNIAELLNRSISLTHTAIKKCIGLKGAKFNDLPEKIKGNTTNAFLLKAIGKENFENLDSTSKYKFWHTLFFASDYDWLYKYAIEQFRMEEKVAADYANIDLEPDYGSISLKAIRKILPYMKLGHDYAKSCELAGYHHSFDEEADDKNRPLDNKIIRHENGRLDEINELRNPIVQQALSEVTRLVNAIIAENGKPDKIRVELARELKKPKKVREAIRYKANEKNRLREKYTEFLKDKLNTNIKKSDLQKFELWLELEFHKAELDEAKDNVDFDKFLKFAKNVKSSDLEKYKLYLECSRISPYTGKVISLQKLFSPDIEVEHIIPYSKFPDDSFVNKTLCERTFNAEKGNRTAMQYFKDNPDKKTGFIERVKHFGDAKQERFMMEVVPDAFLNSQLTNNAYIARQARKILKRICRDVYITNGQVTSQLRKLWKLNEILNPDGKNEKSRHDHRHHAIDALVIANTDYGKIQALSLANNFNLRPETFPLPFEKFRMQTEEKIGNVLISLNSKKRLLEKKNNKYVHSKKSKSIRNYTIRGALHEETLYGRITHPESGNQTFVIRKPVSTLSTTKQIDKIIDNGIREKIREHLRSNSNKSISESLKEFVYMLSKDGKKKIPIYSVRMSDPAENMIQLRPNENKLLFVSSGNNYCIAIYEQPETGRRKYITLTFYDAIIKKMQSEPLVPRAIENYVLLYTLRQKDYVVLYKNHKDEVDNYSPSDVSRNLYRVVKFDVNGIIYIARHNISRIIDKRDRGTDLIQTSPSTMKGIKVKLTTTGKLVKCYD